MVDLGCSSVKGSRSSYGVDRMGLMDLLLGNKMLAILSQFTELNQLHFNLWENDGEYDAGWWMAEMARRLPDGCHAAVSVKVHLHTDDWHRHLWRSLEEIDAAWDAEIAAEVEEAARQAEKEAAQRKAAAVCMLGSLREHPAFPPVDVDAILAENVYDSAPSTPIAATMEPGPLPLRRRSSTGNVQLQDEYWERRHVLGL
ncbi:hypothetical protein C8Q76DRAFT_798149 [Earliella scabrosa]|nr:hypothetical protein C8Q76DRAFT_798149 [Earliella scabrosa]